MEQILVAAEDLGDPTDTETGWDVHFKRVKTGPLAYNVEYQLQALKCKPRGLDEAEKAAVEAATAIDELLPRPTPDAQKELMERIVGASSAENTDDEVLEQEFDVA